MYGFVDHGDTRESIHNSLFSSLSGKVDIAQYYIYVTQVLIGDTFMVSLPLALRWLLVCVRFFDRQVGVSYVGGLERTAQGDHCAYRSIHYRHQ